MLLELLIPVLVLAILAILALRFGADSGMLSKDDRSL
jgi:hypothetical protein